MTPERSDLQDRLRQLEGERDALVAERDQYAQQYAQLLILQQVFSAINSTMPLEDLLGMVLRGVREAIGFGRVVLFEVEAGRPVRRLIFNPDEGVAVQLLGAGAEWSPIVHELAHGAVDFHLSEQPRESPLPDTIGPWCLLPLAVRGNVRGMLFADRPPGDAIDEVQIQSLFDFAAQAAIAIENARLYAETRTLATTDPLTGLLNRRALAEHLQREIASATRYGKHLGYVLLDLDDLKGYNDRGGHNAGDQALCTLATVLRGTARGGDIVARYAGDEFVVAVTQAGRPEVEIAVQRLFSGIHAAGLRCSAGIAIFPEDGQDPAALFTAADEALYAAKHGGKDRFAFRSAAH